MRTWIVIAFLIAGAGCKGDSKPESKPASTKSTKSTKAKTTKVPQQVDTIKLTKPAKNVSTMCCCKTPSMNMVVESASCKNDLSGTCIEAAKCE